MFIPKTRLYTFWGLPLLACSIWLSSCTQIDLYEKVVPVPQHQWQSSFKPEFTFTIKDTSVPYQLYVILRHNNRYKFNNVWVNLYAKAPNDSTQKAELELPLANKEGWLGSGMDDIFEHRIRVSNGIEKLSFIRSDIHPNSFFFTRPGAYTFTLEQIMRDDPLKDVMNVGIRIEKKMP